MTAEPLRTSCGTLGFHRTLIEKPCLKIYKHRPICLQMWIWYTWRGFIVFQARFTHAGGSKSRLLSGGFTTPWLITDMQLLETIHMAKIKQHVAFGGRCHRSMEPGANVEWKCSIYRVKLGKELTYHLFSASQKPTESNPSQIAFQKGQFLNSLLAYLLDTFWDREPGTVGICHM